MECPALLRVPSPHTKKTILALSGHHSLFSVHMLFPQVFGAFIHGFFSATRTPNSQNHSYLHYSLSKFMGEWFTNHSNHIHIFTPITRIVATKFLHEKFNAGLKASFSIHKCSIPSPNFRSQRGAGLKRRSRSKISFRIET